MMTDDNTVKHTAQYHLKKLDEIAKTGVVPEQYKKIFKGMQNPSTHIKAVNSTVSKCAIAYHKEHKKGKIDYDHRCELCKTEGKAQSQRTDDEVGERGLNTAEKDGIKTDGLEENANIFVQETEKKVEEMTKVTSVENREKEEPDDEIGDIDIVIEEQGKQKLFKLKEFQKKMNMRKEEENNEG